jgi:hypothetical protein
VCGKACKIRKKIFLDLVARPLYQWVRCRDPQIRNWRLQFIGTPRWLECTGILLLVKKVFSRYRQIG